MLPGVPQLYRTVFIATFVGKVVVVPCRVSLFPEPVVFQPRLNIFNSTPPQFVHTILKTGFMITV
jgi:hypothetical protein